MVTEKHRRVSASEFEIEITNDSPDGYMTAARVSLPASDSELRGALERSGAANGAGYGFEILYCKQKYLRPHIEGGEDVRMLNELARKLSELEDFETEIFKATVGIDAKQTGNENLSVERLLTLANSTECCVTAGGIHDDEGLGRFLFENDMLPDEDAVWLETKRDAPSAGICFAAIGQQHRTEMDGVFTKHGYLEFDGAVNEYVIPERETSSRNEYEAAEIFGAPALFTNSRVDRSDVTEGLHAYDIRSGDDGELSAIEPIAVVNHAGTIITAEPLEFGCNGYIPIGDGLNFLGETQTLAELAEQYGQRQSGMKMTM
jgi:hypothetical protein